MSTTSGDPKLVAFCGLYCGACGQYKRGKCPGCAENEKAGWCKIRTCCQENNYATCAACTQFASVTECGKFDNFMSRIFALIFRSNRPANIARIKAAGIETYADEMAAQGRQSLRRGERQ
ncbi:MAG: DUF3795 domain-containing protein, partial [Anaerolineae bacterium]|nr:DUF3795 domain-containing protein [Anaerolineae bacterium]